MALEGLRGDPDTRRRDEVFGPPRGRMLGQYAVGGLQEVSTKFPLMLMLRAVWLVLGWKLRGKAWPHPFFDRATQARAHPLTTLSPAELEALRAKCGPHPIATAQA